MFALSVRQPYVELILRGEKMCEYRSRPTSIRGTILLYAPKTADVKNDAYEPLGGDDLTRGLVVGSVEVLDCQWSVEDDCYVYRLGNPKDFVQRISLMGFHRPDFGRFILEVQP